MQDMQEVTQELHYENYRSEKLAKSRLAAGAAGKQQASSASTPAAAVSAGASRPPAATPTTRDPKENLLQQKEEEIRRMREMMERLQAELEKEKHTPPATPATSQESIWDR